MALSLERPRGFVIQSFRESIIINGKPCTREQFVAEMGSNYSRIKTYEEEVRGTLAPLPWWILAQITWDDQRLAEWIYRRPRQRAKVPT
jgi:hypothetical protein